MVRKILAGLGVLVLAGAVFGVLVLRGLFGLDDWVVRQVVKIVETYIEPRIGFETFDYRHPGVVTLVGTRLTARDGTRVVDCERLVVELAQTPRRGEPIVIERVEIRGGELFVDAYEDPDGEVRVHGLVPFVKEKNIREQESVDESVRLSKVLEIRSLAIKDSAVRYDPVGDLPQMVLDGIELDLAVQPEARAGETGWYALEFGVDRAPIFDLDFNGRFNLDTLAADIRSLVLDLDMGEEAYPSLPPDLQKLARDHEVRGRTEIVVKGTTDADDPLESALTMTVRMDDAHFATGGLQILLDDLLLDADFHDGLVLLDRAEARLLGGEMKLTETMIEAEGEEKVARASWSLEGIDLRRLLREQASEGEAPYVAGILSSSGRALIDPGVGLETVSGSGEVHVRDGRLINSPGINSLLEAMDVLGRLRGDVGFKDTADVVFTLGPSGVDIPSLTYATTAVAAQGSGTLSWDMELDLLLNAGPIKKLSDQLGLIGKGISNLTGRLVKYRISGTLGEKLKVEVKPLGL